MRRAALVVALGLLLVSVGLWFSPAPWLAAVVPGVALIVFGLLWEVDDASARPPR